MARVRARQVYAISRLTIPMMLANIANALAMLIVMEASGQSSVAVQLWAASAMLFAAYTIFLWYTRRGLPFPEKLGARTTRRVVANAAVLGAIWTVPGLFFLPETTGATQAFIIALAAGMIAGGSMALYPLPAAALTYTLIIALGSFLGFSKTGDPSLVGFAVVTVAFFFIVTKTISRHSELFVSEFIGRLELDEKNLLIEKLLQEVRAQANDERVKSERRLAQAQKMEAIGQLTGGIAHDFNNLLAAIQGHAELIALENKVDDSLTGSILRSTRRGSELVRGLLSVARKQPLENRVVDVGVLIERMVPLLSRTLGGRISIEKRIAPGLWKAFADVGHLESAVLNLALNARDAMPDGGKLTLRCVNANPETCPILNELEDWSGDFVCLSVSDTGHGMSPEVKERALEPFFTTKKFGDGSGLGLSTVYGFCRQSGGHLSIASDVGEGTTVHTFFPRAIGRAELDSETDSAPDQVPTGSGERLLVVEDDEDVRSLTVTMLKGLGYRVAAIETADAALDMMRSDSAFDLVLADVRLPGKLNGLQLAERLAKEHPQIHTVIYSGYPEVDSRRHDNIEFPFLRKPFSRRELASVIAAELTRRPNHPRFLET